MRLFFFIAIKHLMARRRQSLVSLSGIVIGVGFFLAISSLMQGSQKDFIARLIDKSPHITVSDEYRSAQRQPAEKIYADAVVELRNLKPQTETRGIRGYRQIIDMLREIPGIRASAVQNGNAILSFAGRDVNIVLNGMAPEEVRDITTIEEDMVEGSVDDLIANRNGIIVGQELVNKMSLDRNDNITLAAATDQVRTFKIVGIFRTGQANYDESQAFTDIKRVQALMDRPNRANRIIVKLDDPYAARGIAERLEGRIGYKSISWQEESEDLMSTLLVRNIIMYSVVSAVLVVAAFGIYNVISTVVMEKYRDIAILKSMGFRAADVQRIFLIQGILLGLAGVAGGLPFGSLLMYGLMQVRLSPPGLTEPIQMPLDWSLPQFLIAGGFAFGAALFASYLPARKAAAVMPIDILRGGT